MWGFSGKSKDSFRFRDHQGSRLGTSCFQMSLCHFAASFSHWWPFITSTRYLKRSTLRRQRHNKLWKRRRKTEETQCTFMNVHISILSSVHNRTWCFGINYERRQIVSWSFFLPYIPIICDGKLDCRLLIWTPRCLDSARCCDAGHHHKEVCFRSNSWERLYSALKGTPLITVSFRSL